MAKTMNNANNLNAKYLAVAMKVQQRQIEEQKKRQICDASFAHVHAYIEAHSRTHTGVGEIPGRR